MKNDLKNFIQSNSPDGGFLQSEYWAKFQDSVGRKTYILSKEDNSELIVYANIIAHTLPVVGNYFYVPRGPIIKIFNFQLSIFKQFLNDLILNAEKQKAVWVRIEPFGEKAVELIKENLPNDIQIKKSSVDMQPREILVMDISKSEEEILTGMKQKTRYNIKLSKKRGVSVKLISNFPASPKLQRGEQFPTRLPDGQVSKRYIDDFLRLIEITSKRDKITAHPENYYRKMFETIPPEILKLYVAEYEGKVIAANLMLFFGRTATYLHGASDNVYRDVMAPYLLQWRAIKDAKEAGCARYDFGGVKTVNNDQGSMNNKSWVGITRFKIGFAPDAETIKFPGCYDIILKSGKYNLYRILQKAKRIF